MSILRQQVTVPVTAGDTSLLAANPTRVALVFSTPKTNGVWVSFVGPSGVGVGFRLHPGQPWVVLDQPFVGHALQEEIRASAEAGQESISVLEFFT